MLPLTAKRTNEATVKAMEAPMMLGAMPLTVESIDNHVYFYSDVDDDRCLDLLRQVSGIDRMLRMEKISRKLPDNAEPTPIYLHINSFGGYLHTGMAMYDQLRTFETPIVTIIEGCCASAGTLLSLAGSRRLIYPNSVMLVHQLSTMFWGTASQQQDEMKLTDMYMNMLYNIYASRSNMSVDEMRELLAHDYWMDANECLTRGFVDGIISVGVGG